MDEAALEDTGGYGPLAYYCLARWLDGLDDSAAGTAAAQRTRLLYRRAFDEGQGLLRREAGLGLISSLDSSGQWEELLSFSKEYIEGLGPEWRAERPRLDALDALGRGKPAAELIARLSSLYPRQAAADAEALAFYSASASLHAGGKAWAAAFRAILLVAQDSPWSDRAAALLQGEPRLAARFAPGELHAIAMRAAVRSKNYGQAYKEALLAPEASMGGSASRAMIADAGRAFLYGGALKEGEARFTARGWTARYYRARFARSLGRWTQASLLFRKAALDAPTRVDADSARWYAADCAYRAGLADARGLPPDDRRESRLAAESKARQSALDELVADSSLWLGSESFSDLTNSLFRDALAARDWGLIESMGQRLAPRLRGDLAARIAYTAARAFELDLEDSGADSGEPDSRAAATAVRFAAIVDEPRAPLYYRALASWRARLDPSLLPLGLDREQPAAQPPEMIGEAEALVSALAGFGLVDLALSEARQRGAALGDQALRRLAALFAGLSRPDCALRLVQELASRPGYEARRSDYELLYPRPYLELLRSLKIEPPLSEALALGLLRSESLFKASAVSPAGAIGLSQLMPATATDQARALGLKTYDLATPKDNLYIGLSHFAMLLKRAEGRPLRAMMAYNAGMARLRKWSLESGELPDDLMVEALGIEETRQYCRNILLATVMYGELYYGQGVAQSVGELVDGQQ